MGIRGKQGQKSLTSLLLGILYYYRSLIGFNNTITVVLAEFTCCSTPPRYLMNCSSHVPGGGGPVWANGGKGAGKGLIKGYDRPLGKELGEEREALTR